MKKIVLTFFIITLFISCGPSMSGTWQKSNYTPKSFKTVAVIAIDKSLEARQSIESSVMSELRKDNPNLNLVSGLSLFPLSAGKTAWTEANIEKVLKQNNVDAVLATVFVKQYTSNDYIPGDDNMGFGPGYAGYPGYYGAGAYMYSAYDTMYTPGYYEQNQHYVLESSLFDLSEGGDANKALVWKGQSEVEDPSTVISGASSYAKNLVKYMDQKKVLN